MKMRWQSNIAGFVRRHTYFFRRQKFLDNYISVAVEAPNTPDSVFSVTSLIDTTGQSAKAIIDSVGQSVAGSIFDVISVTAGIDTTGQSAKAIIDSSGLSVTGTI